MAHTDNRPQPSTGPIAPADAGALALRPPSRPPMALWVLSAILMLLGALLHFSPFNREWMLGVHTQAIMLPAFWGALTLLAFGWSAVILVCLCNRRSGLGALAVLISLVVGGVLVQVLKHWAHVSRPGSSGIYDSLQFIGTPVTHGGSMPSGHAVAAFSAAALAWLVLTHERKPSAPLLWGLGVLAGLSAWSRVAVGAHWPADVLAGSGVGLALAGGCWLAAMGLQAGWHRRRAQGSQGANAQLRPLSALQWVGVLEVCACLVCLTDDAGQPDAIWVQWGLGLAALVSAALRFRAPRAQGLGA